MLTFKTRFSLFTSNIFNFAVSSKNVKKDNYLDLYLEVYAIVASIRIELIPSMNYFTTKNENYEKFLNQFTSILKEKSQPNNIPFNTKLLYIQISNYMNNIKKQEEHAKESQCALLEDFDMITLSGKNQNQIDSNIFKLLLDTNTEIKKNMSYYYLESKDIIKSDSTKIFKKCGKGKKAKEIV